MEHDLRGNGSDPLRFPHHLFFPVILSGNDQSGQLYMTALCRSGDKPLHRLQITAQFPVPAFLKPFQIDVHGVNKREDFFQDRQFRRAVSHKHVLHPALTDQTRRISHILISHQRLIVGKCHSDISLSPALVSQIRQFIRTHLCVFRLLLICHGYIMILAEGTGQITSITAHGKDPAARMEVPERLLLNGIQHQAGQPAIAGTDDLSAHVFPGPAPAVSALRDNAVMETDRTG